MTAPGGIPRQRDPLHRAGRARWRVPERVVLAHALAAVGMSLPWPLLLLEVSERSSSGWVLGLAAAARMLPYVAISWCAARLGDRVRRDRLVRATLAARVVLLTAVGAALLADMLLLAVVAATLAVAVATPAYPSLAAGMPALAGSRSERMTGLLVTVEVASFVVGPAVGGLLLVPVLRPATVAVALALVVLAWVLMVGVRLPAATGRTLDRPREPLRHNVAAVRAIAVICVVNLVLAGTGVALVGLAAQVWGSAEVGYGITTAALGFGALAGPLVALVVASVVRSGLRAPVGMVLLGAPVAGVALASGHAWALAPLALAGAAATFVEAEATGHIQRAVRDDARAGVLGVTDSAMVAAAMVGAFGAPLLGGVVGHRWLVVLLGAVAAGCLLLARPHRGLVAEVVDVRDVVVDLREPAARRSG
jgi:MFS family permease